MSKNITQTKILNCGVQITLAAIGGRWKLVIIYFLLVHGPLRFGALNKLMPAISKKVLTSQLRELEAEDIVLRQAFADSPSLMEYSLTEYGRSLEELVISIRKWGENHAQRKTFE